MILLITNETDHSTNDVIDWIHFGYNQPFVKIGSNTHIFIEEVTLSKSCETDVTIRINGSKSLKLSEVSTYWYRRGQVTLNLLSLPEIYNPDLENQIRKHLTDENNKLLSLLFSILHKKRRIGNINNNKINKLDVLDVAQQIGLDIPTTQVVTSKRSLLAFYQKHIYIITKSINNPLNYSDGEGAYVQYTEEVTKDDILTMDDHFHPTLVQEMLPKKYEIRTFYLNGKCHSMAIFSQLDRQTRIDFRKYNRTVPNRTVPFKLPSTIEKKIDTLMRYFNFISGSLDIVVTTNMEYVFLEVNPIGQFGMTSDPCNYYLEREIATYLCK